MCNYHRIDQFYCHLLLMSCYLRADFPAMHRQSSLLHKLFSEQSWALSHDCIFICYLRANFPLVHWLSSFSPIQGLSSCDDSLSLMHHKFPTPFFAGLCLESHSFSISSPKNKQNFLLISHFLPFPSALWSKILKRSFEDSFSTSCSYSPWRPFQSIFYPYHATESALVKSPLTIMLLFNGP